eukprot:11193669-Lingulodinium_polyedra.AAC.1
MANSSDVKYPDKEIIEKNTVVSEQDNAILATRTIEHGNVFSVPIPQAHDLRTPVSPETVGEHGTVLPALSAPAASAELNNVDESGHMHKSTTIHM